MNSIFQLVYKVLLEIAEITGFTYHEINIIVYFILVPALFLFIYGRASKNRNFFFGFAAIVVFILFIIPDFSHFSTYLFNKFVDFLNWFEIIGLNYIEASVVVCVLLPILMFWILMRRIKRTS